MRYTLAFLASLFLLTLSSLAAELGQYGVTVNIPFNGVATDFLNGTGGFSAPAGGGGTSSTNWIDVSTNSYNLGNVGIGTTPITAQKMTLRVDGLTTLPINGFFLTNATAATAGVQVQDSPAIYQSGNAWLTGSLSNAPVVFRSYVVPGVGATAPTGVLKIESSLNGLAFGSGVQINSSGNFLAPFITSSSYVVSGAFMRIEANSGFEWTGRSGLFSSANGAIEAKNNAVNAMSTLQANIPQVTKTSNYTIVSLDSGLRFVNIGAVATNRLDLPTAAAGMHFWVYIDAAQNCRLQATGSDVIRDAATVSGAGGGIESLTVGSTLHVFSPKALLWVVDTKTGTWVGPNGP